MVVAQCVTDGRAVDDMADRLAACDGTIPPEDIRASTSGLDSGEITKTSLDEKGLRFKNREWTIARGDGHQLECAILLG